VDLLGQAIVLGIVQGLTEFLPISSSGHLIIVPTVLGWDDPFLDSLLFSVMLHLGTLIALLIYFWREWVRLAQAAVALVRERSMAGPTTESSLDRRLVVLLAITVVPGAVLGALLNDIVEQDLRSIGLVALLLAVGAAIMWVADRWGAKDRSIDELTPLAAFGIGLAQALALMPGVSRSGITISGGLFAGLNREAAARFAFYMSGPIIGGAIIFEARHLVEPGALAAGHVDLLVAGVVASLLSGLVAIRFLLRYLQTRSLNIFVAYRVILAVAIVIWLLS
jgi:undecaprenyl-diphosphatase